MNNNQ